MAADILSLSKARKTKARAAKEQGAVENRILFGRSKAEKTLEELRKKRIAAHIDGAKRMQSGKEERDVTKK
ncbi:MAG: DUF4169 family protein [Beijerinckiaceae bacterium]